MCSKPDTAKAESSVVAGKSTRRWRMAVVALWMSHAALAQESSAVQATESDVLEEVRVYAKLEKDVGYAPTQAQTAGKAPMSLLETPQSISVVTRDLLDARQITNLQQALQTVAGVSPVNFGRRGFDDVNIRGFRSSESILIDGLVQSPGMWTRLQQYGYERVEVLKGASSVLYGQVQPGGIINAVSKRPKKTSLKEVFVETGSFGLKMLGADFNQPLSASGKSALRINALATNVDDATDFVYRKDRWLAPSLSLDFGDDTDFVLFTTYNNGKFIRQQGVTPYGTLLPNINGSVPLTLFTGDPAAGIYDVEQYTAGYSLEHRFNPDIVLRQNIRYEEEKGVGNFVSNQVLRQPGQRLQNRQATQQFFDYDLLATDTSLLTNFSTLGIKHRLVAGLDVRVGHNSNASRACTMAALDLFNPVYGISPVCPAAPRTTDAPSKLTVAGLYLQDQIKFGDDWTTLVGVRHDNSKNAINNRITNRQTEQKDSATTFSAGLVYEFVKGWATYASYSESFLPVSGTAFDGSAFVPETGEQSEIGLKYAAPGGGITGALAVYELTRQNVTTADPDPTHTGFSVQTGEQRARGVELEVGVNMARSLQLTGNFSYTDAEVTRDNNGAIVGLPVNLTPKRYGGLFATYQLPVLSSVSISAGGRYVSEQVGPLPFSLPSYVVADVSATYRSDHLRITAGVKNLFDEEYYDGAINANVVSPALPRNYAVSLTASF